MIRTGLPIAVFVYALLAFVVPMLRRPGALVISKTKRPVERLVGVAFGSVLAGIVVWSALVGAFGPDAIGAWASPPSALVAGGLVALAGLVVIVAAQATMGSSWRIGIDD